MTYSWNNVSTLKPKRFVCGYCGSPISSEKGFFGQDKHSTTVHIFICHTCSQPTYFDLAGIQYPGVPYGNTVKHIPSPDVSSLYGEARQSISVKAYTGSVLCSRKLLMSIAVSKGAPEGQSFLAYVDYLTSKGYVPPDGKEWVDHIRQKGNDATHQIEIMTKEDAEDLITFIEALLKFIYEYPGMMAGKRKPGSTTA